MNELISLADQLGQQLKQHHFKIATAESCTGGGIGFYLTSIAGSSDWFDRGFITYSNIAKIEMLGVNAQTLKQFGAVSENVVREMAEGALAKSSVDFTVAVSGIAGPDGGSPDKPVGTVWIAYAGKHITTETCVEVFPGNRENVRLATIRRTLTDLLRITKS